MPDAEFHHVSLSILCILLETQPLSMEFRYEVILSHNQADQLVCTPKIEPGVMSGAGGVAANYLAQSARDWRMISSNSALVSPLPKVKVPVRCCQSSRDKP